MNTIKVDKKNTKMIAHRGLSGLERENTVMSFVAAGNRSYYGIETDVHLTKDNVFVICHDAHTARISPFNVNIKELNYGELKKIEYYNINTEEPKGFLRMPTLKEYLEVCEKYEKHSVIEMKPEFKLSEVKKLLKEILSIRKEEDITIIAFSLKNLQKVRKLNQTIDCQYLRSAYTDDLPEICQKNNLGIDILWNQLNEDTFKAFKEKNIVINAWTVNLKERADYLIENGIDYITTNILE